MGGGSDSGPPPTPDAGAPPPGPDTQPPQVTITSPANNAVVPASTTIVVQATDTHGVDYIELLIDTQVVASKNVAPYEFSIALEPGTHVVTAVAYDKAKNKGQASVTVTVQGTSPNPPPNSGDGGPSNPPTTPPPVGGGGLFGAECHEAKDCKSALCVYDTAIDTNYCSERCGEQDNSCPGGGVCLEGSDGSMLCGLSQPQGPQNPQAPSGAASGTGGCSLDASPAVPGSAPIPFALTLLILVCVRAGGGTRRSRGRKP